MNAASFRKLMRLGLTIALAILAGALSAPAASDSHITRTPFTFGAGGDIGGSSRARASLDAMAAEGIDLFVALGDLSYNNIVPEQNWCNFIKYADYPTNNILRFGPNFPFELISGNHEHDNAQGYIDNFAACLPNEIPGLIGEYGKEFYFDYPPSAPLARFILISPNLTFQGQTYNYWSGTPHYTWTADAIDGARQAGIPWVIVGMHKNCISTATQGCEISADLLNLLIDQRVDLILQGHDHNYQRSKQLALSDGCTALPINTYDADCVVNDGVGNVYVKGAGTVLTIAGMVGAPLSNISPGDPENDYFAQWMGRNFSETYGFLKVAVDDTRMSASFIPAAVGNYTDNFLIARMNHHAYLPVIARSP
jgi:hypothetical protein